LLTISRLRRWSINYYNETADAAKQAAMNRQAAGGGLGEYYSEGDTRAPTWVVVGDKAAVGDGSGLDGAALHAEAERTERHLLPRSLQTCSNAMNNAAPTGEKPGANTKLKPAAAPPPTNEPPKHKPAHKHPNVTAASTGTA